MAARAETEELPGGESYMEKYTRGVLEVEAILGLERLRQVRPPRLTPQLSAGEGGLVWMLGCFSCDPVTGLGHGLIGWSSWSSAEGGAAAVEQMFMWSFGGFTPVPSEERFTADRLTLYSNTVDRIRNVMI